MSDQSRKDGLEREALFLIQLGNLVQKARSDAQREAVTRILSESGPVEEKIRRIEAVDAGEPDPPPTKKAAQVPAQPAGQQPAATQPSVAPTGTPPPASAKPRKRASADMVDAGPSRRIKTGVAAAARRRAFVHSDVEPCGFFAYLFKERTKIQRDAGAGKFLHANLLGVKLKESTAIAFLERLWRTQAQPLIPALDMTLADGWHFLHKPEYNRVAALRRLAGKLDPADTEARSIGAGDLERRVQTVALAFLPFRIDSEGASGIVSSIETVLGKLAYPVKELEGVPAAARALLQDGGPPSCLQDLILAVDMRRSRRFLRLSDIVRPEREPLFSFQEFDCSDEVQTAIDDRVAALAEQLAALDKQGEETLKFRAFVRRDQSGNVDYGELLRLYESDPGREISWAKDEDNVMRILLGIVRRLRDTGMPLLASKDPKRRGASTEPRVDDPAVEFELSRLSSLATKIERTMTDLPSLSRSRFMGIKAGAVQATSYEAQGAGLVGETGDCCLRLGKRLAEILRAREGGITPEGKPKDRAEMAVEAAITAKDGQSLEMLAFRERLSSLASAAYLAALYFQEPTLNAALKNERKIEDQRRSILAEVERLADSETFISLRGESPQAAEAHLTE